MLLDNFKISTVKNVFRQNGDNAEQFDIVFFEIAYCLFSKNSMFFVSRIANQ